MPDARERVYEALRTELTAAAWYLDRALATRDADTRNRDIQHAGLIHGQLQALMGRVSLLEAERRSLEEGLTALRSRLEASSPPTDSLVEVLNSALSIRNECHQVSAPAPRQISRSGR